MSNTTKDCPSCGRPTDAHIHNAVEDGKPRIITCILKRKLKTAEAEEIADELRFGGSIDTIALIERFFNLEEVEDCVREMNALLFRDQTAQEKLDEMTRDMAELENALHDSWARMEAAEGALALKEATLESRQDTDGSKTKTFDLKTQRPDLFLKGAGKGTREDQQ